MKFSQLYRVLPVTARNLNRNFGILKVKSASCVDIAAAVFIDLPLELYLETVQAVMLLLSDVSRQVLHALLQFLAAVADHSEENQVCFEGFVISL